MAKLNISEHFDCNICAKAFCDCYDCVKDFQLAAPAPAQPSSNPYSLEDYLDTFDIISDASEQYFQQNYAGEYHSLKVWERIMDYECNQHPEWADEENL